MISISLGIIRVWKSIKTLRHFYHLERFTLLILLAATAKHNILMRLFGEAMKNTSRNACRQTTVPNMRLLVMPMR